MPPFPGLGMGGSCRPIHRLQRRRADLEEEGGERGGCDLTAAPLLSFSLRRRLLLQPHLAKRRPPATISSKPQATGTPLSLSSVNSIDLLRLRPSLTGIPIDAKIRCRLRWIRRTKVKTVHPFVAAKERRTPPSPWTRPRRCLKLPLPSVVVELPLGEFPASCSSFRCPPIRFHPRAAVHRCRRSPVPADHLPWTHVCIIIPGSLLPLAGCDSGVGTERRAPIPVGSDGRWASSSATTQVHAAAAEAARGGGW